MTTLTMTRNDQTLAYEITGTRERSWVRSRCLKTGVKRLHRDVSGLELLARAWNAAESGEWQAQVNPRKHSKACPHCGQ